MNHLFNVDIYTVPLKKSLVNPFTEYFIYDKLAEITNLGRVPGGNLGNQLRLEYVEYPTTVDDGVSLCGGIPRIVEYFDPLGNTETEYKVSFYFLSSVLMNCKKADSSPVEQFNLHEAIFVYAGNREVLTLYGRFRDELLYVDYGVEPDMGYYETLIEDQGGIDISLIASYPGYYIGGWFATVDIESYNDAWISVDFQANPNRFNFGELTLDYHGFTCQSLSVDRRKLFISYRTWMPTIEPGGEPEEVSVWVPTPTWDKASGIKWGLFPSVKGKLRVWFMRFLIGMDAYF